jgi:2'-5' RNA ligase
MTLVVELFFDTEAEQAILAVRQALATALPEIGMSGKPYEPHISLGTLADEQEAPFMAALPDYMRRLAPLSATMAHYGVFPEKRVVFLGVTYNRALYRAHSSFYRHFAGIVEDESLFAPPTWVPHCTLAYDVPPNRLGAAIDICRRFPLPIDATINRLALVTSGAGSVHHVQAL